jgi:hypothetical protein
METRPVGAEMFYADRRKNRHDEAKSRFSQFCEKRLISSVNVEKKSFM